MKQARIKLQLGLLLGGLLGGLQLGPANSLAAQSLVSTNPRQATIKKASTKKATTKKAAVQKTPATAGKAKGDFELVTVGGRATWLSDALRRRWGVNVVPEARQRTLAIEATDGRLFTVVEDRRGRAFRNDPRLLQSNWEFVVRKYRRTQIVRIVHSYELKGGKKYVVDYWCDICSISHVELEVCSCCQGPLELRKRLVSRVPAKAKRNGKK